MHDHVTHATLAAHAVAKVNVSSEAARSAATRSRTCNADSRHTSLLTPTTTWSRCAARDPSRSTPPSGDSAVPTPTSPPTSRRPRRWRPRRGSGPAGLAQGSVHRGLRQDEGRRGLRDLPARRRHHHEGSGLKIDVAPVLYEGEPDDRGYLVTRDGERVLTSVTLHLAFLNARKNRRRRRVQGVHPAGEGVHQASQVRRREPQVQELPRRAARRAPVGQRLERRAARRQGLPPRVRAVLRLHRPHRVCDRRSIFTDYYAATEVAASTDPIRVWDPVNPANNVAAAYTESDRMRLVQRAGDALDAITWAATRQHEGRGQRRLAHPLRPDLPGSDDHDSSMTRTATFTITDARHIASKVGADLRNLNSVYGKPPLASIDDYVEEVALLLKAGYLEPSTSDSSPADVWKLRLRYTATIGGSLRDDNPGRLALRRPRRRGPVLLLPDLQPRVRRPHLRRAEDRSRRRCRSSAPVRPSRASAAALTARRPRTPATATASAATSSPLSS